ncbi:MAG TPA: aminodeoxychorismate/anthranilate synthase component II [Candidatus Hydrogenedens sp.]|nr:aminodeoxychorismate/anthranilate synthase component II [Candidatus Hydrogenedens sp.]
MILIIDNYDSFTYNLFQYLGEMHPDIKVHRNDAITIPEIEEINPDYIVISPGPCTPQEAGISVEVIKQLGHKYPILGVCLGHQSIGYAFGGEIVRADRIMHGKISQIYHNNNPLFKDIPSPFEATRYHSLIIRRETCPKVLKIIAETKEGEIMAVTHNEFPIWGVQFHPESILTQHGKTILKNFLELGKKIKGTKQ